MWSVLEQGLKKTSRGDKGDDSITAKTDHLLDRCRPAQLKRAGVSRDDNLYCYRVHNGGVVDITNGEIKAPDRISESPDQRLLKVTVDAERCYVSDLDLYDQTAEAVKNGEKDKAKELATAYWQKIVRLDQYNHNLGFRRPEVMVTYDIPPKMVEHI